MCTGSCPATVWRRRNSWLPDERSSPATEANSHRQVGGAIGVALFGTLIAVSFLPGLRLSLVLAAGALLASASVTARWVRVGRGS